MYFPGDPLFAHDPIFNAVPDPGARPLISDFDLSTTNLSGRSATAGTSCSPGGGSTPLETGVTLPRTPSQTGGAVLVDRSLPARRQRVRISDRASASALRLTGRLLDGDGEPVADGMVEIWDAAARRWGRSGTDEAEPSRRRPEAASVAARRRTSMSRFSRAASSSISGRASTFPMRWMRMPSIGSSPRLTRGSCPVVAEVDDDGICFDIHLQGALETIFFSA